MNHHAFTKGFLFSPSNFMGSTGCAMFRQDPICGYQMDARLCAFQLRWLTKINKNGVSIVWFLEIYRTFQKLTFLRTWKWVFPKIGIPQNGWFILEIPIKMDDLGVPLFSETPKWMVWRCFFPFGARPICRGKLLISSVEAVWLEDLAWFSALKEVPSMRHIVKRHGNL